ncbi:tRNA (adenine(22)-N(1))-methyltransferase [Ornithinibacillus xuwenensis]|uniref:tRNA (Adenine(22)-N(1))-methyltransferase TrmK n=1 Tax=Ornithinibacillus xuwenensis TaxID=3144668 RepID=A0ABU9XCI4_9BACI
MSEQIKLSERLLNVASFLPQGSNFADIGSDHAYLPCYVCQNDQTARAIAGEVNEGPFSSAQDTVEKYQLNHLIDVRLGNGLSVLKHDEVEQVVIAGMGGSLIRSILEEGKDKLSKVELIIAQPNVDEKNVRHWLTLHDYEIQDEVILEENGHTYEIIVGKKGTDKINHLTEKDLLFGPILGKEKNELFCEKWTSEKEKLIRVINQMKNAKIQDELKISHFEKQLAWIEEVLGDGKNHD